MLVAEVDRDVVVEKDDEDEEEKKKRPAPPAASAVPPPPPAKKKDEVPRTLVAPVVPSAKRAPGEVLPEVAPQERTAPPPQKRVKKTKPTREFKAGDKVCGRCGEANEPVRNFCSRCGSSLAKAERITIPWWQQLIWSRGGPTVRRVKPGEAPKERRVTKAKAWGWLQKARSSVIIIVIAVGALVTLYPPLRTTALGWVDSGRESVMSVVGGQSPTRPVGAVANAELPGHPAGALFDGFTDTYWAAPFSEDAPPAVQATFGGNVALRTVIIHNGAGTAFNTRGRPALVEVTYSNELSETFTLEDTPEPQEIPLRNGLGAETVQLAVQGVHGGVANDVAISEIEFFAVGG